MANQGKKGKKPGQKKDRYTYEHKPKVCKCRSCLPGTNGAGRVRPLYLVKKHARLDLAARRTEPRTIEPNYTAQPFSRPVPVQQRRQQQQQQQQQVIAAVSVAADTPDLLLSQSDGDDAPEIDVWDDGDYGFTDDVGEVSEPDEELQNVLDEANEGEF